MLETAALLALCVQVADLSSLYLSFEPTGASLEQVMDEAEIRWVEQLRAEVGSDAAFVSAMQLDGAAFWDQWGTCQANLDTGTVAPGQKG
jgi:hypothetical protein